MEINYKKNIMASMRWTNEWLNSNDAHKEYLFLMEKTPRKESILKKDNASQDLGEGIKMPARALVI